MNRTVIGINRELHNRENTSWQNSQEIFKEVLRGKITVLNYNQENHEMSLKFNLGD